MSEVNQAGRLEGHDIEEYNQIVDPWKVNLRQTETGRFHGRLEFVQLNGILVYREHWSRSILATGATPKGYFMFGGTLSPKKRTTWCDQVLDAGNLACGRPGSETEFTTPSDARHAVILVPTDMIRSYFGVETIEAALVSQRHTLSSSGNLATTLLASMNHAIDKYLKNPELLSDVEGCSHIESEVLENVAEIVAHNINEPEIASSNTRKMVFERAIEICEHLKKPISIPQLAAQVGVSQRTLDLSFQERIGISPRTYIRWNRIRAAHRELLHHDPTTTKVSDVATNWNFTELGRFATEYKCLFGELPSETLKKRKPFTPRRISDLLR
jgi:AraC family ethanolamine operon transcriptional activator